MKTEDQQFADGVDNSPEGIESVRQTVIEHRNKAIEVWPKGIDYSVLMTHVIALLAELKAYKEAGIYLPPEVIDPTIKRKVRRAAPPQS